MRNLIFMFFIACLSKGVFAQDVYKKRYYVADKINYTTKPRKGKKIKSTLSLKVIDEKSEILKTLKYTNNKEEKITETIRKPRIVELNELITEEETGCFTKIFNPLKGRLKANLLFKDDKVLINPWLIKDSSLKEGYKGRDKTYFFKLKNRQSLKIPFRQWSFNALSVPLKVRFGSNIQWSTGANLGALLGYTWGKTNFVHRKEIGNKQYDSKFTLGGFLGASELEFTFKNDSNTDIEFSTALLSSGLGLLYSYQNFTLGITGGFDFGLGGNGTEWDYHGKPWLGIALGYSLSSF